jgi:hypothetical protein
MAWRRGHDINAFMKCAYKYAFMMRGGHRITGVRF